MALDWQTLSVSLAQGMDTKTDPKQMQSDYVLLQNAIYDFYNQLNPRYGFTALSATTYTGGSIAVGNSLGTLRNSLLEYDGQLTYARTTDLSTWTKSGQKTAINVGLTPVGTSAGTSPFFTTLDMARASNGLELYVWINRLDDTGIVSSFISLGLVYYSVFDPVTQNTVTSGNVGTGGTYGTCVRAEVVGTNFFIITSDGATVLIFKQPIATPNFSTASSTSFASATEQVATCVSSTSIYILADKVHAINATTLAVTSTAGSGYGAAPSGSIAYDSVNNQVWAIQYKTASTNNQATVFSSALAVVAGPTVISSGVYVSNPTYGPMSASASAGTVYVVAQAGIYSAVAWSLTVAGAVISNTHQLLNLNGQVYSSPALLSDGYVYFQAAFISSLVWDIGLTPSIQIINPTQPTTFLLKFSIANATTSVPYVAAKSLPLETGNSYTPIQEIVTGYFSQQFWPPARLIAQDALNYIFPNLKTTTTVYSNFYGTLTTLVPTCTIVRSSFEYSVKLRTQEIALNSHTTGGYLSSYDSSIEAENNFHIYPEISFKGHGVGSVANGTYGYIVVYSWIDANGQIQRSQPSTPLTVTVTGGPKSVQIYFTVNYLSDKFAPGSAPQSINVDFYRTAANGTTYYYQDTVSQWGQFNIFTPPYFHTDSSATTSTLELYTTGGEVGNIAPPATSFITTFKNRLFLISSENPLNIWYTKQVIPGSPAEFSDLFVISIEERGGATKALASLDDKLIIFKETALFYMVGDGPSPAGTNNDFSYPQMIPTDSGAIEPDSVVSYPEGVFYKGSKGIYLLTRNLTTQYIGANVEAYNQYTVTSAKLDYNLQCVRFTLNNGVSLVYDYYMKKWSIFTNISAVAAVISNGVYHYLQSNGIVQQETPDVYSDNGSVISMGLTSGWLSFAKIQGFERVRLIELLGELVSACTITVTFAYDFDSTVVQTATITSTVAEDPWQWRIFLNRHKCEALQIGITVTPTVVGQALSLSVISLEAGLKRGLNKLSASRSTS